MEQGFICEINDSLRGIWLRLLPGCFRVHVFDPVQGSMDAATDQQG